MYVWVVMFVDVFMVDNYNLKKLLFFKIVGEGEFIDNFFLMLIVGKNLIKLF